MWLQSFDFSKHMLNWGRGQPNSGITLVVKSMSRVVEQMFYFEVEKIQKHREKLKTQGILT